MRALFLLGRLVVGGCGIQSGLTRILRATPTGPSESAGDPAVRPRAACVTGALLLAGGLSVIGGVKPRAGLGALVVFLIPTALHTHRFWGEADPRRRTGEMVRFAKNVALAGAALALMQVAEPWPASLDARRAGSDEEMFVRIGGRTLRALPK